MNIYREVPSAVRFTLCAVFCIISGFMFSGCAVNSQLVQEEEVEYLYDDQTNADDKAVDDFEMPVPEKEGSIVILEEEPNASDQTEVKASEPVEAYEEIQPSIAEKETREIPQDARIHKVWIYQETGDCLWMLAKKYYGDTWKWKMIYLENKDIIDNPNIIFPKQELVIPPDNE
jgi:nucleoid-associated protein YgaU